MILFYLNIPHVKSHFDLYFDAKIMWVLFQGNSRSFFSQNWYPHGLQGLPFTSVKKTMFEHLIPRAPAPPPQKTFDAGRRLGAMG